MSQANLYIDLTIGWIRNNMFVHYRLLRLRYLSELEGSRYVSCYTHFRESVRKTC